MKRFITVAFVAFAFSVSMNAQTPKAPMQQGKNSLEIGFNPFSNNYTSFRIDELKYRHYFGKNALRIRGGFGVDSNTDKTNTANSERPTNTTFYNGTDKTNTKSSNFNLEIGYERHFDITHRLSLYAGFELGYEGKFASSKTTKDYTENGTDTWYNSGNTYTQDYTLNETSVSKTKKSNNYNALVGGAFLGTDVYVFKGLYLGAEIGLSFNHKHYLNPETTSESSSVRTGHYASTSSSSYDSTTGITVTTANGETTYSYKSLSTSTSNSNGFKLYAEPALRIGWRF